MCASRDADTDCVKARCFATPMCSLPLESPGHIFVTCCVCSCFLFRPPRDFISHWEHFRRVMPAWCCWLVQILFISIFLLSFCASTMVVYYVVKSLQLFLIFSTCCRVPVGTRCFILKNIDWLHFFADWLPVWLDPLCADWCTRHMLPSKLDEYSLRGQVESHFRDAETQALSWNALTVAQ